MGTAFLHGQNGGGSGCTLTVNAPAGSTVTVSKDGKSKTKVAGSDGIVVFKGLQSGTWNLSITDGRNTASKTVDIVADYATSIAFFAATINVTFPAGSTCTATDGTTTLTAPNTSGTWACVVPNTGTWTVTATHGTNTKSEAVSITTDGQSVSLTLSYRYYLYNYLNGQTAYDGITGGWNEYTTVDGCVSIANLADMDTPTRCSKTIDCSGYTTLGVEIYLYEYTSGEAGFGYAIGKQTDNTIFTWGAIRGGFNSETKNAWTIQSIDVSSLTTPVYVAIRGYYAKGAIRAMWLE